MTLTMQQAAQAYAALRGLMKLHGLRGSEALALIRLRDALRPVAEAYDDREQSIVRQYADQNEQGEPVVQNGTIQVSDPEREQAARRALSALREESIEIAPDRVRLDLAQLDEPLPVSADELDSLCGLIEFGGGGDAA